MSALFPDRAAAVNFVSILPAFLIVALLGASPVLAQPNFEPLERGDFEEEEDRVLIIKGLEVSGEFAIQLDNLSSKDLDSEEAETGFVQDFRFRLNSTIHRDMEATLVLEPFGAPLDEGSLREEEDTGQGRLPESQFIALNAREAYLRYRQNPNSAIIMGKHELSLGDRRGKVFHGLVPGFTFDCDVGTWCMPFGGFKINDGPSDWVYHWGLEYTAWDETEASYRRSLQVELFRYWYKERNVPLGRNLGPTVRSSDGTVANGTQATDDAGNPIYYDAHGFDYFGFRMNWEMGRVFWNLDFTSAQGSRVYHRFREDTGGTGGPLQFDSGNGPTKQRQKVRGWATETEVGFRWPGAHFGWRYLLTTGDSSRDEENGGNFLRGLGGYYELTPGAYQGTRLFFNGFDSNVGDGSGLGHSVTNIRMYGFFWQVDDPENSRMGFKGGIYELRRIKGVRNINGKRNRFIGYELDNMLTVYLHSAARLELEANIILQGEAFSYDDFTAPDRNEDIVLQTVGRIVYEF